MGIKPMNHCKQHGFNNCEMCKDKPVLSESLLSSKKPMPTTKLRQRISIAMEYMELGGEIRLSSGHTLTCADGDEEFGFLTTQTDTFTKKSEDMVMQIGSDTAWMALVSHLKKASDESIAEMVSSVVLTSIKKKRT